MTSHPRSKGSPARRLAPLLAFGGPFLFVAVFLVYPYLHIFQFSLYRVENFNIIYSVNFDNYLKILTQPLYRDVIAYSLRIGFLVTVFSLPLGYLLAYYLVFISTAGRQLLYFLIVTPLWTSFLLRVYVWKLILGRTGVINQTLMYTGLVKEPVSAILFNEFSVCLTLIYIFIPFVFLPIYTSLEKISASHLEASFDLGAPPLATFWRIILPLSMPGVVAGAIFTFCLSFGDFVAPALVGGPSGLMISNVIIGQFGGVFDWPLGSALAVVVLCVVLVVIALGRLAERRRERIV